MVRESPDEGFESDEDHVSDLHPRSHHSHEVILDAVMAQLADPGYHRMTIEGVAAEAGVRKATLHRWWSNKTQLVIETLRVRCEIEPVVTTGDLRADVRSLVQCLISVMHGTPLGQILPQLLVDLQGDPRAKANLQEWLGPARAGHRAVLYYAASRSELPHDIDASLVLDLLGGTVMWRILLGHTPDDRLVEQLTDLIVDRALPRTGPPENAVS